MASSGILSALGDLLQNKLGHLLNYLFNTRAKKLVWMFFLGVMFIMYFNSSKFILPHRHLTASHGGHKRSPKCLESMLEKWYTSMENADAVVKHLPSDSVDKQFLPFLGNGFIGLTVGRDESELYILNDTKNGIFKIPFQDFIEFKPMGETPDSDETLVLDLRNGKIHFFTTFNGDNVDLCIVVEHIIYIHREIPGALVQDIKVNNFRPMAIHGRFKSKTAVDDWKQYIFTSKEKQSSGFTVSYGTAKGKEKNSEKIVAIASSLFAKEMKMTPYSNIQVTIKTAIREVDTIPEGVSPTVSLDKKKSIVEKRSQEVIEAVKKDWTGLQKSSLYDTHQKTWEKIWKLGIRIDSNDDPDSPSPLNVNITEYYLYSLMSLQSNSSVPTTNAGLMDSCFHGSPTMHSAHFWVLPRNIGGLLSLAKKWQMIMQKYGCKDLVNSGLFGLQKAIVLSFTGLQYTKNGLELAVNPISLSSNISLRRVPFLKSLLFINIRINPPHGIKTVEIHSDDAKNAVIFACGSACEEVVEISQSPSVFIAKVTNPVTPILYVSYNRTNLDDIGQSDFMKKAVEDSQISEHPSFAAHHFKIPAKFWFAVILAIVLFHVIVIKMIYTECRKERTGKRTKKRGFKS